MLTHKFKKPTMCHSVMIALTLNSKASDEKSKIAIQSNLIEYYANV